MQRKFHSDIALFLDLRGCCVEMSNAAPVLCVVVVLMWSYYVYIFEFSMNLDNSSQMYAFLVAYHLLLVIMVYSYLAVVFTRHDRIPIEYRLPISVHEQLATSTDPHSADIVARKYCEDNRIPVWTRERNGNIRYCLTCKIIKPDRTHHCRKCQRCILRMDHHCPWVDNCVGHTNYKIFIVMALYFALYCTFMASTLAERFIGIVQNFNPSNNQLQIIMGVLVSSLMACVMWVLFINHVVMLFSNQSTLEGSRSPTFADDEDADYNQGAWANCYDVCGTNCCCWWLPTRRGLSDGVNFRINRNATLRTLGR